MPSVYDFLQVTIPSGQKQAHVVEIEGGFDASWGVEVHTINPYEAEIDRLRGLTITDDYFYFESLYLNETGYHLLIKLSKEEYNVKQATAVTEFRRIQKSI
ncbi:hypothetical protein ABEX00_16505 [Bacillus safensis]|uniref:hypothetical protein n=1 Tax=Bacillus TaxID=1386 RepID=UPI000D0359F4|nr:hypothetical protein [Bacillus sp. MZGC1]PRS46404.1 hypothetical protein C6Y06_19620 [Bacillus sp. MZGC1]